MKLVRSKKQFIAFASIFCLAHYFIWLYVCFPGVYYGDNAMMLAESFAGIGIGDQHSVMFIWMLRICHLVFGIGVSYPLIWGLFFWHLGVFFFLMGLYALRQSYWILLFGFGLIDLPFINFVFPHLQLKDFNMSAVLLAACGLLFWITTQESGRKKNWMIGGVLLLFFLAVSFRHNGIFAFVPLAFLVAWYIFPTRNSARNTFRHLISVSLISLGLVAGLFLGKSTFDKIAGDYENYFVHGCLFSFDLAGISVETDQMEIPKDRLLPGIELKDLKKVFNTAGWDPLWGGWGSSPRILKGGENKEELRELRDQWFTVVSTHLVAYLNHRRKHFDRFIRSKNEYLCTCEWPPEQAWQIVNSMVPEPSKKRTIDRIPATAFALNLPSLLMSMEQMNKELDRTRFIGFLFMRFPFYALDVSTYGLITSFLLTILVWIRPRIFDDYQKKVIPFAMFVILSGWVYFVAYFFVSVSSDWRYIHWSILAFWIGLGLLISTFPYQLLFLKLKHSFLGKTPNS